MALPEPPFKGACLCGSVQIHATARPLLTVACHCRDCQKFTASAFSLTTMFPTDNVTISGPLITGGLGNSARTHRFCESCLNFIFSQIDGATHRVNLRTSLLDNAALFRPFIEIMTEDKVPWAEVPVDHSFLRTPATQQDLDALMEAYANL